MNSFPQIRKTILNGGEYNGQQTEQSAESEQQKQ